MSSENNEPDFFEEFEKLELPEISEPIKEEACQSAVVLGIIGGAMGLVLFPFLGITFAIAGLYVNAAEKKHYKTAYGYRVNIISIIISLVSWIIALIIRQVVA